MDFKKIANPKQILSSSKDLGVTLAGFIAGNAISTAVKKDNWKINGLFTLITILLYGGLKKDWEKQLAAGAGVYFGTKTLNNFNTEVVSGLEGVPDSVKSIISKYVPRLGEVGEADYTSELSSAERQILLGYADPSAYSEASASYGNAVPIGVAGLI